MSDEANEKPTCSECQNGRYGCGECHRAIARLTDELTALRAEHELGYACYPEEGWLDAETGCATCRSEVTALRAELAAEKIARLGWEGECAEEKARAERAEAEIETLGENDAIRQRLYEQSIQRESDLRSELVLERDAKLGWRLRAERAEAEVHMIEQRGPHSLLSDARERGREWAQRALCAEAERYDLRKRADYLNDAFNKASAEIERMRPLAEAAEEAEDAVEWLEDDSARTEEWEQAWWDLKVAVRAASSEPEAVCGHVNPANPFLECEKPAGHDFYHACSLNGSRLEGWSASSEPEANNAD